MCAYSMMADEFRRYWQPMPGTVNPYVPTIPSRADWEELKQLMARVKVLEEKLGACPCPDAGKDAWMSEVDKLYNTKQDELGNDLS